ncbi:MAG: ribonuclease HI [Gemmatimonadota bacterium]
MYIYADESCLGNQFRDRSRPGAAAGLIESFDARRGWYRRDYAVFDPDTTNNRMAIRSAIVGLGSLKRPCDVVFTSDSQYLIKGMSEWVHGWARKGWRRRGGPIENVESWRQLVECTRSHRIEWRWVRGHADHPKNEYANDLAVRTAREGRSIEGLVRSGFEAWLEERQEEGKYLDFLDLPPEAPFRPAPPAPR